MLLAHELLKFVDDRLQEGPMRAEEVRELAHNIHNIGGDLCFI
jgi:hypothetical protein